MYWKRYKRINNAVGGLTFVLATITYLLTISHSANLWDTAEFVVCINKLEVGHPPGSPFFMLLYNLATQFTSDPMQIATLANGMSAVLSGMTIFFLYLTITHLARRLLVPGFSAISDSSKSDNEGEKTEGKSISTLKAAGIMLSGFGGAMLYAFTDTFWYSAVEAEVYAFSSFFTALVFWLMLEWEERSNKPDSDRWLILIAYCFGLSIGVHLLNLLCLPAMALIFYFRRAKKPSFKGSLGVLLISFALIAVLMFGVIQGSMKVASLIDLFMVNILGMPFNSGLIVYVCLLLGVIVWSIVSIERKGDTKKTRGAIFITLTLIGIPFISENVFVYFLLLGIMSWGLFGTKRLNLRALYTLQLSAAALFIGFCCYGVIVIRSAAQPPMNENNPSTPIELKKYLNREQYGSTPLLYGQSFASRAVNIKEKKGDWMPAPKSNPQDPDRYKRGPKKATYVYDKEMAFPRVYSTSPEHIQAYNMWMRRAIDDTSQPSFLENLRYFFSYQVNYMYWRYFGWNFIGRQNDLQGHGGMTKGGVATGFNVVDRLFYGDKAYYPDEMAKNKGHNVYFLMPLILGLLGIAYQLAKGVRGIQSFWIVFFFFIMTGLAIIVYINQTPFQPRERDYAYAGSFYAFAIWIGLGIMGIWDALSKLTDKKGDIIASVAAFVIAIAIPLQMLGQNYDDHDRSGRTAASDMGYNYLISCEDDAIIFCFGDNDTFPLWYSQEIEATKRDSRATNLSYLAAEWYVDQMQMQAYSSDPVPLTLMNLRDFYYPTTSVSVLEGQPMELGQALDRIPKNIINGTPFLETNSLYLPLDSVAIAKHFPQISLDTKEMLISLSDKRFLGRDGLSVLDLIRSNNWERPIYWVKSSPTNAFTNLTDYLASSGAAWKLYPTNMKQKDDPELVDHEYDLVMNKFRWFGASGDDVYYDENIRNNIRSLYRGHIFPSLVLKLAERGEIDKATQVIEKCFREIPAKNVPYDYSDLNLALACYKIGMDERGDEILKAVIGSEIRGFEWFKHLPGYLKKKAIAEGEVNTRLRQLIDAMQIITESGRLSHFASEQEYVSATLKKFYGNDIPQPNPTSAPTP